MTLPLITVYPDTIPSKGQNQVDFDANMNNYLPWQTTFATQLTPWITFANNLGAALLAGNLPPLTGQALKAVRVNATDDGVEFVDVTAAGWTFLAATDAAAQRTALEIPAPVSLTQAQAEDAASTVFGQVSGERLAQAVSDNLNASGSAPMYACRAWVNFNGTGTVSIRGSGNVSSITDHAVGDYTVNFTTAMDDINYVVLGTQGSASGTGHVSDGSMSRTRTTGAVPVVSLSATGTGFQDPLWFNVAIFC